MELELLSKETDVTLILLIPARNVGKEHGAGDGQTTCGANVLHLDLVGADLELDAGHLHGVEGGEAELRHPVLVLGPHVRHRPVVWLLWLL